MNKNKAIVTPSTQTQTLNNSTGPDYQPNQNPTNTTPVVAPTVGMYTRTQIATHNGRSSCWLLISGNVYDVTDFLNLHPGGVGEILPYCGKEATQAFATMGGRGQHSSSAYAMLKDYLIGKVG